MSFLARLASFVQDPPPEYAFELSDQGIAWSGEARPVTVQWKALAAGTIGVSPLRNNVLDPEALRRAIDGIAPQNGNRKARRAALILPDHCARVGVLDFDTFPGEYEDQLGLVRFRVKRALALDVEAAQLSWHAQHRSGSTRHDVVVAAIAPEIASHYQAPFRAAGYQCGFTTISGLAALSLGPPPLAGTFMVVKLTGRVLALSVLQGSLLKLVRCLELASADEAEVWEVILPTLAFVEDQLAARPESVRLCGIDPATGAAERWSSQLGVPVEHCTSRFGTPGPYTAGIMGYLEGVEP